MKPRGFELEQYEIKQGAVMKLWKAHGLGNDYLVWEGDTDVLNEYLVRLICHRHTGIGGDGILEPRYTEENLYGVRIWNPDGSVAEKSGNGLRIFAHWLHYMQNAPERFFIDTGKCRVQAHILKNKISIEMGKPTFVPQEIPSREKIWNTPYSVPERELNLYSMGIGNPHCVAFLNEDLDTLNWREWGKQIESDALFPNRTNVQFAKVVDD